MMKPENLFSRFNVGYINPLTLCQYATLSSTWEEILSFHNELASDDYIKKLDSFYREALKKFGRAWFHLDVTNILYAASKLIQPKYYLEIGIRRGRSLCIVVKACSTVNVIASDIWIQNYAGMDNPGPDFIIEELKRYQHQGELTFLNGDSQITLPSFFNQNPHQLFDLILVDGDHSEAGAMADLSLALQYLAPGGILVFDDIAHPLHPYLHRVWRKALSNYPHFLTYEYLETGYGIAFAVSPI